MSEVNIRDLQCENCRKFSHCNNNDLVCIKKFQQLKTENVQLKENYIRLDSLLYEYEADTNNIKSELKECMQCLDEIEKIVNYGSVSYNNHKELADFYEDKIEEIIKLIKQAKEGK